MIATTGFCRKRETFSQLLLAFAGKSYILHLHGFSIPNAQTATAIDSSHGFKNVILPSPRFSVEGRSPSEFGMIQLSVALGGNRLRIKLDYFTKASLSRGMFLGNQSLPGLREYLAHIWRLALLPVRRPLRSSA